MQMNPVNGIMTKQRFYVMRTTKYRGRFATLLKILSGDIKVQILISVQMCFKILRRQDGSP